jgi:hypothetical protein
MNKVSNLRKLICNSILDNDDSDKNKENDDENEIWTRLIINKE